MNNCERLNNGGKNMQFKTVENKNSNKLHYDQYYTPYDAMEYCVNKSLDVIKKLGYEVSEFLEPSAGEGIFSDYLRTSGLNVIAMDLYPKQKYILQQDYLSCNLEYKPKRFIIGNPPYGSKFRLGRKFYNRSCELGDYISFILPIRQLNNTQQLYKFDLVYSEDLGELLFSDHKRVHCCLNVYVRPKDGLNKKKNPKLKDIDIIRQDSKRFKNAEYDIRMCHWGDATAGKILKDDEHYSGEYKIKIHNEKLKNRIIEVLNEVNWKKEINNASMCSIKKYHIIDVLKKYIPDIS